MRACVLVLLLGCYGTAPPVPPAAPAKETVEPPMEPVVRPPGYVELRPLDSLQAGGEMEALLLLDAISNKVVPIFIGGTEGTAIRNRLRGAKASRPLTHDLLDEAVKQLGGAIVKVHIDALVPDGLGGGIFHGSVYIRSGRRLIRLDSRSSDAVALGIGNRVPIYCAQSVIDDAGIDRGQVPAEADPAAP
jgi:bifunctional DNase/RNase